MEVKNSKFKLHKQPVIKKFEFSGNNEFNGENNVAIDLNIEIKKEVNVEKKRGQVQLFLYLNDKKRLQETPFLLKGEIIGQFLWEDADLNEIDSFLNTVAPSIMLSYMRPIISNLITYSGFPPYIIPFLDLR